MQLDRLHKKKRGGKSSFQLWTERNYSSLFFCLPSINALWWLKQTINTKRYVWNWMLKLKTSVFSSSSNMFNIRIKNLPFNARIFQFSVCWILWIFLHCHPVGSRGNSISSKLNSVGYSKSIQLLLSAEFKPSGYFPVSNIRPWLLIFSGTKSPCGQLYYDLFANFLIPHFRSLIMAWLLISF